MKGKEREATMSLRGKDFTEDAIRPGLVEGISFFARFYITSVSNTHMRYKIWQRLFPPQVFLFLCELQNFLQGNIELNMTVVGLACTCRNKTKKLKLKPAGSKKE